MLWITKCTVAWWDHLHQRRRICFAGEPRPEHKPLWSQLPMSLIGGCVQTLADHRHLPFRDMHIFSAAQWIHLGTVEKKLSCHLLVNCARISGWENWWIIFICCQPCTWPQVSHPLAQQPEPGGYPPSAIQGSHVVSALGKDLFCQHEYVFGSGREESLMWASQRRGWHDVWAETWLLQEPSEKELTNRTSKYVMAK